MTIRRIRGKVSTPEELKQHVYLTYGTLMDEGIDRMASDIQFSDSDVFFDLGSGIGNVCDRIFKTSDIRKCVGIEYDEDRYLESVPLSSEHGRRKLAFIHGNFMHQDWSEATVLFMDSIMFSDKTLREIEHKALTTCPNLRYLISMKKMPSDTKLAHLKTVPVNASWGLSQYHMYDTSPYIRPSPRIDTPVRYINYMGL